MGIVLDEGAWFHTERSRSIFEMARPSPAKECSSCTSDDDYASSVSLSKMLYGENLVEWLRRRRPGVSHETQSGGPVKFPSFDLTSSRTATVVRAPMGSGKTSALIEWLDRALRLYDMSVLIVSCRRSFTHTLAKRFYDAGLVGFVTYFEADDYILRGAKYKRLLVQAESLHRVDKALLNSYNVIVLDEAMSIICQLYSPTMKRVRQVDESLTKLLRGCPRVLIMDATVNAQLIDTVCELRGEEDVHVIIGDYATKGFSKRRCTFLRKLGANALPPCVSEKSSDGERCRSTTDGDGDSPEADVEDSFFTELRRRIKGGLNVCIFSSTLTFSEIVASYCRTLTPSVLVLNSESKSHIDVSEWSNFAVVVYTTVVTVGLSFDLPYFHAMFAYVKPSAYGPDMVSVYQSLGRVRKLLLNELLVYVDGSSTKDEQIFTPMLLNHVIVNGMAGGWPTAFAQVTGAVCCAFRGDCSMAFRDVDDLYLFQKFKYKHLFERCTLSSLNDSINILHSLLDGNFIKVRFSGTEYREGSLSPEEFTDFMSQLRADSKCNQKTLRTYKTAMVAACRARTGGRAVSSPSALIEAIITESDEAGAFVHKYIKSGTPAAAVHDIMTRLRDPTFKDKFINATVLEACLGVHPALRVDEVFDAAYRIYGNGPLPYVTEDGDVCAGDAGENFDATSRRDVYRSCALIADALKWSPSSCDGDAVADSTPEEIHVAVRDYKGSLRRALLELKGRFAADENLALSATVREVANVLNGNGSNKGRKRAAVSMADDKCCGDQCDYSVALLKVVLDEMFGANLVKSTRSFPGFTKVKNLRKAEIERLLDDAGVSRDGLGTHKQLYSALMANKAAFSQRRYRIKRPKWHGWLKPAREAKEEQRFFFSAIPDILDINGNGLTENDVNINVGHPASICTDGTPYGDWT